MKIRLSAQKKQEILANGKPITNEVLEAKAMILSLLDQQDLMAREAFTTAQSTISKTYLRLTAEYACGIHTDEAYLLAEIAKMKNDVDLMLNE